MWRVDGFPCLVEIVFDGPPTAVAELQVTAGEDAPVGGDEVAEASGGHRLYGFDKATGLLPARC